MPLPPNNIAPLPKGFTTGMKPSDIDAFTSGKGKYIPIIETLKILDSTSTVQLDVKHMTKGQITGIKQGIKSAARKLNFPHHLKFAEKHDILHIWANK